ncbi:MAG: PTS transporter subunit EIIC [Lachnospiraceae bacterium]|nr:PTS transporter subunit EIIC [Lachnospiraceae bacterium]
MSGKYEELVSNITRLVGGKENVAGFEHCVTRLRFDLKDKGLADSEAIGKIGGISGIRWLNNQLQVIVGPDVGEVYDAICERDGYRKAKAIEENLDQPAEEKPKKKGFSWFLEEVSGAVFPAVTVIIATSFISLFVTILEMCGVSSESGTIQLLSLVADCGLYFLPVFVGASAARKFGGNTMLGMLLGAMMLSPTFTSMVSAGESLSIYGLPVTMVDYSSNFLPVLLAVAVMVPVEKFFKKIIPTAVKGILVPFLTMMVMIPLTFCLLGPIASIIGGYLSEGLIWLTETFGFVGIAIITAVCPLFIICGMHMTLVVYAVTLFVTQGYETTVFVAGIICTCVECGIMLAVMLRSKNTELKSTAGAALVCAFGSGTTEPALFGVTLRSKWSIAAMIIGGFAGGCVAGIGHAAAYTACYSAIWNLVAFIPGGVANVVWMVCACIVGFVVGFAFMFATFKEGDFANE